MPPGADPRRPATTWDLWSGSRVPRALIAFVGRQIAPDVTRVQLLCDLGVGAFLPLLLLWLDRAWDPMGAGGFVPFRPYPGVFAGLGAAAVVVFHVTRRPAPLLAAAAGGALMGTAIAGCGLSTLLLPLSTIGILFYGLGLLGFLPFAAVFCQARCAVRSLRARETVAKAVFGCALVLTLIGGVVTARLSQRAARRAQEVVLAERDGDRERALLLLAALWRWPGVELPLLERAAWQAEDVEEYGRLEALWCRVTGDTELTEPWD